MLESLAFLALTAATAQLSAEEVCDLPRAIPGALSTRSCMACHDGSVASRADVRLPAASWWPEPEAAQEGSHPVDVDYEEAALRRPGSLVAQALLPPTVQLLGGRVTCLSCHHPDSAQRFRTSLPMDGSALCRACHTL